MSTLPSLLPRPGIPIGVCRNKLPRKEICLADETIPDKPVISRRQFSLEYIGQFLPANNIHVKRNPARLVAVKTKPDKRTGIKWIGVVLVKAYTGGSGPNTFIYPHGLGPQAHYPEIIRIKLSEDTYPVKIKPLSGSAMIELALL
jgi:hypothetical protein